MKSRKTIEVLAVLEKANTMLASGYGSQDFRKGVASLLEAVLHETGNYAGFSYLDPNGYSAGLTDESERSYHYSRAMAHASNEHAQSYVERNPKLHAMLKALQERKQ